MPTPVVALNRAVAIAELRGPAEGLRLVDDLQAGQGKRGLDDYYLFHATRADLLRRLGRSAEATTAYEAAIALAGNAAERDFLRGRLAQVRGESEGPGPSA